MVQNARKTMSIEGVHHGGKNQRPAKPAQTGSKIIAAVRMPMPNRAAPDTIVCATIKVPGRSTWIIPRQDHVIHLLISINDSSLV